MKSYPNVSLEYVLYEMSFRNLMLYSSIIPGYDNDKQDSEPVAKKKSGLSFKELVGQLKEM